MRTLSKHSTAVLLAPLLAVALICAVVPATAASREEIDAQVREALQSLFRDNPSARELADKASGMLVFPNIIKAGLGIGGEFGEGELLVGEHTVAYYNIASASIGLQLGAQKESVAILFMTADSLAKFRESQSWNAGIDGSIAIATLGAGKELDTEFTRKPIIGFVYSNRGLMLNLTLEGSKITRVEK
ncbi:MAG TPA: YSC84-related protein [Burkholderiaceae bacterium]|nr:YSC84-related protein [Burkholderiaceae bacterium]